MNRELLNELRSVFQEELKPIHKRLDLIEQNVSSLKAGQERLELDFKILKQEVPGLKAGQEKIHNIIKSVAEYTEKIVEHFDNKTEVLNKRVFAVETEILRIIKQ
jgi:prefoldin subunit 5